MKKQDQNFVRLQKKKITSTNKAIKEKIASSTTKKPLTKEQNVTDEEIKSKKEFIQKKITILELLNNLNHQENLLFLSRRK